MPTKRVLRTIKERKTPGWAAIKQWMPDAITRERTRQEATKVKPLASDVAAEGMTETLRPKAPPLTFKQGGGGATSFARRRPRPAPAPLSPAPVGVLPLPPIVETSPPVVIAPTPIPETTPVGYNPWLAERKRAGIRPPTPRERGQPRPRTPREGKRSR